MNSLLVLLLSVIAGATYENPKSEQVDERQLADRIGELRREFAPASDSERVARARQLSISAINSIIAAESKPDGNRLLKYRALLALAEFGEKDDVLELLVDEIDFAFSRQNPMSPISAYPAALALIKIGAPTREHIFSRLRGKVADHKLHLMAYVLLSVDDDVDVTIFRLTKEKQRLQSPMPDVLVPRDPDRRAKMMENLEKMISMLRNPNFKLQRIPNAIPGQEDEKIIEK